ncbi:MAG TPA: DUF1501 domain-containing protein [Ottowia sp.]|uniref:DUF1501 domain-containing protein n=1 Tax=Ottowia sp. TaxID=1898956 RepID=UPI002B63F6BF|nr:DUF1501 domain-containing protein [Ottowia sp.]HMN21158.1 DUF1501 domain-containing protein [Ottowia sp.]
MTDLNASTRRAFLQRLGHLGVAGTAAPWALNLAAMGEAAAFTATDYKALVCVFLYGGNDHGNTVIPCDSTGHAEYLSVRETLATPRASLDATALDGSGLPAGRQYALAPQLAPLKPLFDSRQLAIQLNVGPLVQPTTLAQYQARSVPLPPKLFSHNDQQSVWQSSGAEGAVKGWGGRLGDLALTSNGGNALFTCMSVTGNAVFLSGNQALAYQIGEGGAIAVKGVTDTKDGMYGAAACREALRTLVTQDRANLLEKELNRITGRSIASHATLAAALAGSEGQFDAALPDRVADRKRTLNQQLKMVARLIAARSALGLKRQVFLVSLGGFDNHDQLLERHPALLSQVGDALAGFQQALDVLGVAPQVTTFTASDFGRTMTSNGGGTDHGWGSHHFVLGGAVKGGFYGAPPTQLLNGPEDVGQGRLLPSTSVDQYAATLARWFGVTNSELPLVAPSIANFSQRDLGFLG